MSGGIEANNSYQITVTDRMRCGPDRVVTNKLNPDSDGRAGISRADVRTCIDGCSLTEDTLQALAGEIFITLQNNPQKSMDFSYQLQDGSFLQIDITLDSKKKV